MATTVRNATPAVSVAGPGAARDALPDEPGSRRLVRVAVFCGSITTISAVAAVILGNSAAP